MTEQISHAVSTPSLLTTRQAAELLQVKESTMEQWRWQGRGPIFIKVGRLARYRREDLATFTAEHSYSSTTEAQHGMVAGRTE
jgi:excisionase family DNA binding protein